MVQQSSKNGKCESNADFFIADSVPDAFNNPRNFDSPKTVNIRKGLEIRSLHQIEDVSDKVSVQIEDSGQFQKFLAILLEQTESVRAKQPRMAIIGRVQTVQYVFSENETLTEIAKPLKFNYTALHRAIKKNE